MNSTTSIVVSAVVASTLAAIITGYGASWLEDRVTLEVIDHRMDALEERIRQIEQR